MSLVMFVAVLSFALTACERGRGPEVVEIASTDSQPVAYRYGVAGAAGEFSAKRRGPIRGVVSFEVDAVNSDCTNREEQLRVVSDRTGEVLHRQDLQEDPVCDGNRLVWDGTTLRKLDDGGLFSDPEPWPDDIYDE